MLRPSNESELAEAVASAAGPLRIEGGGTRPVGGDVDGEVLSVAGLSGISLYEPGALTIVAGVGTPVAEIEAALAKENQRLPFEPMDHRTLLGTEGAPTIGGVVAANVSGPRRIQAGACRDSLIGVRFVDGAGTVLKNGGRVMKNVTGYDLVKLMAGSHGTLGVLSEVSFKVLPRAGTEATLTTTGLSDEAAVRALSRALTSPFEVSGAAHEGDGATHVRIEGFESSVAYRAEALKSLLSEFGDWEVKRDDSPAIWESIRDVTVFGGADGDIWRLSVTPGEAPAIAARVPSLGRLFDWGGGLVWLRVASGTDVRAALGPFDGHATLIRADADTKARLGVFHPEPVPLAAISKSLREKFDPRGILNPGRMG